MPQIFKVGSYLVYLGSNENEPIEPIHISEEIPSEKATKIWITQAGNCLLCHNNSKIPNRKLRDIMDIIEAKYHQKYQYDTKWNHYKITEKQNIYSQNRST